jgi:hypothetical protein
LTKDIFFQTNKERISIGVFVRLSSINNTNYS